MTDTVDRAEPSALCDAARDLQPVLRQFADYGDTHRRMADEAIEALQDAGMFRLLTPRRFGGLEVDLPTVLEVTRILGEADGSSAWTVSASASATWAMAHGSAALLEEVFGADPDTRFAGGGAGAGTARPARGGRVVSGRWAYATGAPHAAWAGVSAALTDEDGSPEGAAFAVVPMAEVTVLDTWRTSGLRGTGSDTIVAEEVFVPEHRVIPMSALAAGSPSTLGPLYRLPLRSVGISVFIGSLLGIGSAALNFVIESAAKKAIPHTVFDAQSKSVGVQLQVADAALRLQSAVLHARSLTQTLTDYTREDRVPDEITEAWLHAQSSLAAQEVLAAVGILLDVHGSGGLADASPLQRLVRDVEIGTRHAGFNATLGRESLGKALLGVTDRIYA